METQAAEKQEVKSKKSIGKKSGLRFIKAWGYYLDQYRDTQNNKELVLKSMLEDFEDKKSSVERWVEWYKSYFNMGMIKGYESSPRVDWKK
jgi:hypothetical protein